jgi:uncharacterized membrane protein
MIAYCSKSICTMVTIGVLVNVKYSQATCDMVKVCIEGVDRHYFLGLLHPLSCVTSLNRQNKMAELWRVGKCDVM